MLRSESDTRVEVALEAIRQGRMVVVIDDHDREGEGDIVAAASLITPEQMAFIVRHTSGIVCAPITSERAAKLHLDPMVALNDSAHTTAFTVSIDFKHGTTTGISAEDRTATVRALANGNVGAEDFSRPGHIFPLIARRGGVLMRSGHTEAAVDLCKLAELPDVGVICELVNDDGTVTRGEQVSQFAERHDLPLVSVADLIAYRQRRETLIERAGIFDIETSAGKAIAYAYTTPFDRVQHLAIVFGDVSRGENIPVRLQREDIVSDVFGGASKLNSTLESLAKSGGVLVYLREGTAGVAYDGGKEGSETHRSAKDREAEWREVGLGAQILRDLGIASIRPMASRTRRYVGLEAFGITIAE
ncbi:3,4-dihydroxy-2-butanone-4-phosphate synthase [Pelagibacterium xiamenense]|uniref:3,4-dihydroxy-2-butanone-4-phosphate synthase n=1 Tax=Pelagibacterium xiamenense TaxID=2901140 RepID=UPI001E2F1A11|nr:3,4-dihydroxy-2-butanone-4-phosphate synthase [Pelagibacterium xiamenense]MCD7059327.1 3,4-dihydroxy-2-butanone-4-phosphate synthase [Pelagibacterium xiamenense]